MMKMYFRNRGNPVTDILFWYDIFELQTTEEEVVHELSHDSNGNKRKLPNQERIREIVNERIAGRRKKVNGKVE